MRSTLVLSALLVPSLAGATTPALTVPEPASPSLFVALAHIAAHIDLPVPNPLVARFLRWELGVRDLIHGAVDRLAAFATNLPSDTPDLTILTTEPVENTESSGFGWRSDPIRHDRRFHRGTDFHAKPGTAVLAAGDGVVTFCGRQGGYGNVIYVDHGGGVTTRYAHLRKIGIKRGEVVTAGESIGQVGSTGRTTGPHLHFEIRLDGRAVDPVTAMTVATLERESPSAGRLAAFALAPELQARAQDGQDRKRPAEHRPDRKDRPAHQQALW